MITVSNDFKTAIKANVTRIRAQLVFNYDTPVTLNNEDIISIGVSQKGEIALGCVQDDFITVEIKSDALASHYLENTTVEVKIGCLVNGTAEYASIGIFKTSRWKKDDYEMHIELITNIDLEKKITTTFAKQNTDLSNYISLAIVDMLGIAPVMGAITTDTIPTAYLYYKTVREQLKAFGLASNSLFRVTNKGLEVASYKLSSTVETLEQGANGLILEVLENEVDYLEERESTAIKKSIFIKEEDSTLYSFSGSVGDYINYAVDFGSPALVTYIKYKDCYFSASKFGLFGGDVSIGSGYGDTIRQGQLSIVGTRIESKALDVDEDEAYITSPYIQTSTQVSTLDKKILDGQRYSFKCRIDPSLQVGDTVATPKGYLLITGLSYKYDGSLVGTIEGVIA